ncbi:type II toxin-antitoxin system PemK/MazF family toxin [Agrobacterium vaccinii]|uniref:type II toxin-antitoxin system PemK/MazF family toxin n=1 Tax=Agrobacterium vaccinii TaxID=2735528 RepID=UPI001E44C14E|nr:type II toxin-antitoxin system PemK/MazF family toxin [Agrobacterium vaccinii]UHS57159.1 type II toxin-antitoxin system PemK/MazF family toxin [Agrobacterium vaccinii]
MIYERYTTVVVPFPFAEIPVLKRRPAVVISGERFNKRNASTVVAMITTAKASSWISDIVIGDLDTAGLPQSCLVRWRLATIPNELILRKLGTLGSLDRLACERELAELIL